MEIRMTQITEATFDGGVLRPAVPLNLREHERVRVIVQSLDAVNGASRERAMERLREGVRSMGFDSKGAAYPTRDQLHERD